MDYLEVKGHQPVKQLLGGKLSYRCPLPGHDEAKPSFIVWTNSDYENFYCFGCQSGHTIIHLVAAMEGMSYKEAASYLGQDMEISIDEFVDTDLKRIKKDYLSSSPKSEISDLMISMSRQCRMFLEGVKFDTTEVDMVDKFWEQIDKDLNNYDFDQLVESSEHLPIILLQRRNKFDQQQIEKQRQKYASS